MASAAGAAGGTSIFGIYVHIPFCVTVCPYCDFNVYAGLESTAPRYVEAVISEARVRARVRPPSEPARSIFVGGGTPSLLPPALMEALLDGVRGAYAVDPGAEITVEANPETVDVALLAGYREAGVNRVSLGVQSFAEHVLSALGRAHSPERAREAFRAARDAGYDNVSVDLIFGAPGESFDDWKRTLDDALALRPDHVSCYGLTIEQGTAFGRAVAAGSMQQPDEDLMAAKYEHACDAVAMPHYEISNWGSKRSVHNMVYWTQGDYDGLGAGAHSHRAGTRWWNHKRPQTYMANPAEATAGSETLDDAERAAEWIQLRLRVLDEIDVSDLSARLGRDVSAVAGALVREGLASARGPAFALTRRGMLLENEVSLRLLSDASPASAVSGSPSSAPSSRTS